MERERCDWLLRCQSKRRRSGCKGKEKESERGGETDGGCYGNKLVIGRLDVSQNECEESRCTVYYLYMHTYINMHVWVSYVQVQMLHFLNKMEIVICSMFFMHRSKCD